MGYQKKKEVGKKMFLHDFDFEDLDSIEEVITPNKGSVTCC